VIIEEVEDEDDEEPVIRVPKHCTGCQIVLDDDSEEEGIPPIPFVPLTRQGDENG
jgi:hypothetical protein